MRAAPAVRVRVGDGGAWAAAVVSGMLASAGVCAAWLVQLADALPPWAPPAVALSLAAILWQAGGACRCPAVALRWDGEAWHVRLRAHETLRPGHPMVALDLGAWMLVRFDAAGTPAHPGRVRRHWLPLRRAVVGPQWHALRCALHARPRAAAPPAG